MSNSSLPQRLSIVVSTGAGVGMLPLAPGTWGSLLGVGIYYLVDLSVGFFGLAAASVLLLAGGYLSIAPALEFFDHPDPPEVVVDEIAGVWLALFVTSLFANFSVYVALAANFFLFRFFDVLKPPPVGWLQEVPGAPGVLLDDLAAGFLTALILVAVNFLPAEAVAIF